jgi:hypothetical protein
MLVGLIGLLGMIIALSMVARTRQMESLKAWALANDMTYTESPAIAAGKRWPGPPFHGSDNRDLLSGRTHQYRQCRTFVHTYTTGSGNDSTTHTFTVTVVDLPGAVPDLMVTKEGFGTKLAKVFGGQDIEVGYPPFDMAYRVRSPHEQFARDVLAPPLTKWLAQWEESTSWRLSGNALVCWRTGGIDTQTLWAQLDWMDTLIELIPGRVWEMGTPQQNDESYYDAN